MASPDHDVSRRGGDVGPHRHLEDQTDYLLFFCHLSSAVAKHYSNASWSLRSPCGICCFARVFLRGCSRPSAAGSTTLGGPMALAVHWDSELLLLRHRGADQKFAPSCGDADE